MKKSILAALLLSGCTTPVIKEVPVEVKVPVNVPCVRDQRPEEVKALKDKMSKGEWNALSTDQREKLLLAQGTDRKAYGDKLYVATSGCP